MEVANKHMMGLKMQKLPADIIQVTLCSMRDSNSGPAVSDAPLTSTAFWSKRGVW
jgi:hypothetical protein